MTNKVRLEILPIWGGGGGTPLKFIPIEGIFRVESKHVNLTI